MKTYLDEAVETPEDVEEAELVAGLLELAGILLIKLEAEGREAHEVLREISGRFGPSSGS